MKLHVVRHSLINFVGYVVPVLLGILTIPWLLEHLGSERFGLLALAWAFISYLTLFDFGIGRAMSQQVAKYSDQNDTATVARLFWEAHITMTGLGIIVTMFALLIIPFITAYASSMNDIIQKEAYFIFYFLSLIILPILLGNGLNNFLLALENFILLNLIKVLLNSLNFIIPVWVTAYPEQQPFGMGILDSICLQLLITRSAFFILLFIICTKIYPHIMNHQILPITWPRNLLKMGKWITISNIIGPIMVYFDRFLIATVISPQALTTYAIAFEIGSKLNIIPTSISNSLAPSFAKPKKSQQDTLFTINTSIIVLSSIFLPILILIQLYAEPLLTLWLKTKDTTEMAMILQWLALGFYTNSIALIAYTYIQYIGRPDLTAKLHLIELPIYIILLWSLLNNMGIIGAAIAWTIRATIDMALLLATTHYLNKNITIESELKI